MKKSKGNGNKKKWITLMISSIISILMIVALFVTNMYSGLISNILDADTTKIINPVDDIYTSDFETYEELVAYQDEVGKRIEAEGMVLLQNKNKTLPFNDTIKKLSVFGQDSVDFVYGGSGSGSVSAAEAVSLKTALEAAGYEVNPVLWDFYATGQGSGYRKTYPSETGAGEFAVNEVPISEYTAAVTASYSDYKDAAIVVIGRSGGESADLPIEPLESGYKYLEIDDREQAMIEHALENFDTVVVIINVSNAMELNFLEEYDIDATLWVGAVGQTGMYAIGEAFNGLVTPSGKLVDTYAYDSTSAPSFVNMGDYDILGTGYDESDRADKFMIYGENIYIGYRYYETRYEDIVMGTGNAGDYDYQQEVQYAFGYGLSYTTFEYNNYTVQEEEDQYVASVTVTNTGLAAGKEAVQIYMQSPWTDYDRSQGIEKPSIELVGFDKTQLLEPGAEETITIEIPKELMKVYDTHGAGTYIVDSGTYYFAQGTTAHEALNNILAAKGYTSEDGMTENGDNAFVESFVIEKQDQETYSLSMATGEPITNAFEDVDIQYYDDSYTYLSRTDWQGTWPEVYMDGQWTAPETLISDLAFYRGEDVIEDNSVMPVTELNSAENIYVSDMIGLSNDDPSWQSLMDQMSLSNMTRLVRLGGYATIPVDAIGLPSTTDKDGPSGFSSSLIPGRSGMAYPSQVVMASTWNVDLIEELGSMIGEDSLALSITGWYAPGVNIHRSPYSGRNFEYFSEDSFLGGAIGAAEMIGVRSKGTLAYMKHFALNDQETNRVGGAIFANEQAIRQIFLKSFEMVVRDGGATGVMTSMNRIGSRWSGAHPGLMTQTLREEWGFSGVAITDQASVPAMLYQDMISGLWAGTDLWLNTNSALWSLTDYTDNPTVMNHVRNAAHNVIYAIANSNAMNGISPDTEVITIMPWWRVTLWTMAIFVWIVSILTIGWAFFHKSKGKELTA